jgi:hypothetical protein
MRSDPPSSTTLMIVLGLFTLLLTSRGCPVTPGPGPVPSQVCVLIVEEPRERTPAVAEILTDSELRAWLKQRGHLLRIVPPDSVGPDNQPSSVLGPYLAWRSREGNRSATLPVLLLVLSDGSVYWGGALPGSSAGVRSLVEAKTAR